MTDTPKALVLLTTVISSPALAAQDLTCVIEARCAAAGCQTPEPPSTFGLRLLDGAVLFLTPNGEPAGFGLNALPGEQPERMQVFAGPDGSGLAVLSLRDDGALTLSVHADRMTGAPANDSTLALGRCEVPA